MNTLEKYAKFVLVLLAFILFIPHIQGQEVITYKTIDTNELKLEIHYPQVGINDQMKPAMVFFFGGGWNGGDRSHFAHHAKYFSDRGLVCFLADYRTKKGHGTSPFEAVKDAKSAMRYIREHASEFGIDPDRIIASGGSAGGHLAAATAYISAFDEDGDNLAVSCVPNALVLFNPVIDNGPGGYGFERIGKAYKDFSPLHNIREGAPPTIFFLGTEDRLIPVETAQYYRTVMEKIGSKCDLFLYDGAGHGFFNFKNRDYYDETVKEADRFLVELGYIE